MANNNDTEKTIAAQVYPGVAADANESRKTGRKFEDEATTLLNDNHNIGDFDTPAEDPAIPADALEA